MKIMVKCVKGVIYMSKRPTLCKYCKEEIKKGAKICPHCGKKQGMTGAETLVATIIIIPVMIFGLKACTSIRNGYDEASENAAVSSEADNYSEDEYKKLCRAVTFEELARDKDALKGEKITVTGEIIQVYDDTYRLNITKDDYGYEDAIVFELDSDSLSENILEDDIVTIWGESKGFMTYESVIGQEITVPDIRAVYIDNKGKAEE